MSINIFEILEPTVATIIKSMTPNVEEGQVPYLLDWTHATVAINDPEADPNKVLAADYPFCHVSWTGEFPESVTTVTEMNLIDLSIMVIPNKDTVTLTTLDKAIRDMKKMVSRNRSLAGSFYWYRTSIAKFYNSMNTKNFGFKFNTKVKYEQNRMDP